MDCIDIPVLMLKAPEGISSSILPSLETILPPPDPIVCVTAGPDELPISVFSGVSAVGGGDELSFLQLHIIDKQVKYKANT
jgi:hypothetical protein